MGRPPETEVRPGTAVAIATGAPLPPGADAVLKVEHTQAATPELLEVLRPVTPGEGMVRADEDAAPGDELVPPGRPLRAQDLGMLAAAGIATIQAHARPRVSIVSTGDELTSASQPNLETGQVRDSSAPALAALVREAGGRQASADDKNGERAHRPCKFREIRCPAHGVVPPLPRSRSTAGSASTRYLSRSFARYAALVSLSRSRRQSFATTSRTSSKRRALPGRRSVTCTRWRP